MAAAVGWHELAFKLSSNDNVHQPNWVSILWLVAATSVKGALDMITTKWQRGGSRSREPNVGVLKDEAPPTRNTPCYKKRVPEHKNRQA